MANINFIVKNDIELKGNLIFEGATADAYKTTLAITDPTANRTITFPNSTGTVALTSDLSSYAALSGATFTGTVTIPTLNLTNALGTLYGGTGITTSPTPGSIVFGATTSAQGYTAAGTTGQILASAGTGTPVWTTATFPSTATTTGTILRANGTNWLATTSTFADTYAVNTILYAGTANTITGLATANSSVLVTSASGVPSLSTTLPAVTLTTPNIGVATGTSLATTGNIVYHLDTTLPTLNAGNTYKYTLVLTDDGDLVEMNTTTGVGNTLEVPLNSSVAFPVGTQITVLQTGLGQTTISAAVGVTINATPGLKLRAQWSSATLIKRATNTWVLIGDLTA